MDDSKKGKLLRDDMPFLKSLLDKNFEYVFLNGRTVTDEVHKQLDIKFAIIEKGIFNGMTFELYAGYYRNSKVIGWSPYLQSAAIGGYEKIKEFAQIIKMSAQVVGLEILQNKLRK